MTFKHIYCLTPRAYISHHQNIRTAHNITKAQTELNWQPRILVDELIKIMVDFDMLNQNLEFPGDGIKIMNDKRFNWASNEFNNIKQ